MADKPKLASEYKSEQVELVRAACLYVATKLGDMMEDLLIVGGLVPSLIIDQETLDEDVEPSVTPTVCTWPKASTRLAEHDAHDLHAQVLERGPPESVEVVATGTSAAHFEALWC
jgi:hypothetical protein